jgi:IS30 family transposase
MRPLAASSSSNAGRPDRNDRGGNGTELRSRGQIDETTGAWFYFTTPHHSWKRSTNENANGLIRQYLPKRMSFADVTQDDCAAIAARLNSRPRKKLRHQASEEYLARS